MLLLTGSYNNPSAAPSCRITGVPKLLSKIFHQKVFSFLEAKSKNFLEQKLIKNYIYIPEY